MAQATQKKVAGRTLSGHVIRGTREGALFVLVAIGLYLLMALLTYNPSDPGWSYTGGGAAATNLGGVAGAWFADAFLYIFGYFAFLAPVMVIHSGWLIFRGAGTPEQPVYGDLSIRWAGFAVTLAAGCGLATLHIGADALPLNAGGILGDLVGHGLEGVFNFVGASLLLIASLLAGITLFTGLSWLGLMDTIGRGGMSLYNQTVGRAQSLWQAYRARRDTRRLTANDERAAPKRRKAPRIEPVLGDTIPVIKPARGEPTVVARERSGLERQFPLFVGSPGSPELPPLSLLDPPLPHQGGYSQAKLQDLSRLVESKLADFGIEAQVTAVQPGPVITRFELHPAPGVKVSRISSLAKDLARALSVISVRIVEVIPGKPVVGLEIPNEQREIVSLSEIVQSPVYEKTSSPLTLALGRDIGGRPVVVDLARMPHLLVAGTTGAGKSVAINAMLLSLIYKAIPADVRLILIDPKMLELSVYDGIPHLLAPVVTDMKEAANALRWSVAEMERRYKLMSTLGVRNIAGFNKKIRDACAAGSPITDPMFDRSAQLDPEARAPELETLPLIVIVIDEFADMMIMVGKKVEELIARLAQKARAAGIHLVLATQRPSVDVITGLIKANIPVRIAFQVSSKIDSRTILDQMGAEQLLGNGDMLYLPPGQAVPERVHGAFVRDHEVHKVVDFLKRKGKPDYVEAVLQEPETGQDGVPGLESLAGNGGGEGDALYDEAVAVVTESRKASISYVQRRLKIGYNRAARMIEEMELAGVVSPVQASGGREVLAPPPPSN
ncbi:MAG: DNA translocase FtsK 4TM domain-containing protein [Gammaproteobacteria bacterium]|nr:DNA translocase FtsK 4TM domain-containing protein [Gammaproteobacteria bacterium]